MPSNEVMTQELGARRRRFFATLDPQPMAAASLAQVHAATLHNGEEVVVKGSAAQHRATISTDLDILQELQKRPSRHRWRRSVTMSS